MCVRHEWHGFRVVTLFQTQTQTLFPLKNVLLFEPKPVPRSVLSQNILCDVAGPAPGAPSLFVRQTQCSVLHVLRARRRCSCSGRLCLCLVHAEVFVAYCDLTMTMTMTMTMTTTTRRATASMHCTIRIRIRIGMRSRSSGRSGSVLYLREVFHEGVRLKHELVVQHRSRALERDAEHAGGPSLRVRRGGV